MLAKCRPCTVVCWSLTSNASHDFVASTLDCRTKSQNSTIELRSFSLRDRSESVVISVNSEELADCRPIYNPPLSDEGLAYLVDLSAPLQAKDMQIKWEARWGMSKEKFDLLLVEKMIVK
jgi:hypothetical protein